jgi:hypothetical protein
LFYFVDFDGKIYEITEIINAKEYIVKIRDILGDGANKVPSQNIGYVYKPTQNAAILSQAKYYIMDQSARDTVNNIEKSVAWEHRGIEVVHSGGQVNNVTQLNLMGLSAELNVEPGWQGGKSLSISSTSLSTGAYMFHDDLSNQIDGILTIFTVSQGNYIPGTLLITIGGVINDKGIHYFEENPATGKVRFIIPPTENDKPIIAQYQHV